MANKTREPLVHISRRSTLPWYQSWGIRACALILSLALMEALTIYGMLVAFMLVNKI